MSTSRRSIVLSSILYCIFALLEWETNFLGIPYILRDLLLKISILILMLLSCFIILMFLEKERVEELLFFLQTDVPVMVEDLVQYMLLNDKCLEESKRETEKLLNELTEDELTELLQKIL